MKINTARLVAISSWNLRSLLKTLNYIIICAISLPCHSAKHEGKATSYLGIEQKFPVEMDEFLQFLPENGAHDQKTHIPPIVHIVWFGGVPNPNDLKNWEKNINLLEGFELYFWYSHEQLRILGENGQLINKEGGQVFDYETVESELQEAVLSTGIEAKFKDIDKDLVLEEQDPRKELFEKAFKFIHLEVYCPKNAGGNFAAGSDITRLLVLSKFGGYYFDIDVLLKNKLPNNIGAEGFCFKVLVEPNLNMTANNGQLASAKNHSVVNSLIERICIFYDHIFNKEKELKICENHAKDCDLLAELIGEKYSGFIACKNAQGHQTRVIVTMIISGPRQLFNLFINFKKAILEHNLFVFPEVVESQHIGEKLGNDAVYDWR